MGKIKPSLSFWQIRNMSFGCPGIQFEFAVLNANVSRIFETPFMAAMPFLLVDNKD
jgi:maltose/moltooligosaccharide transporter